MLKKFVQKFLPQARQKNQHTNTHNQNITIVKKQKNMKNIITPHQAVELAWGTGEYMSPLSVSAADIAAAENRYLVPVIGHRMAAALAAGSYEELCRDYAAPALALFVRYMVQPALDIRTAQAGSVVQRSSGSEPADAEARAASLRSLRRRAGELLRRLSDKLESDPAAYPEYDSANNILKHCTTDGGIVQVF